VVLIDFPNNAEAEDCCKRTSDFFRENSKESILHRSFADAVIKNFFDE